MENNTFETDTTKTLEELPANYDWSQDYNKINIKEELKLLSRELIKNSLIIKNNKLFIAGQEIKLKISKKGFLYLMLDDEPISGSLRQECFNLLYNTYRTNERIKAGKYELVSLIKNNKKMIAWLNIGNQTVEFISTVDRANRVLEQVAFWSFRDEPDSKPLVLRANEAESEIYGNAESSLGSLYTDDLINRLEVVKEIIGEAISSTNVEVKELLDEIKDMLDG